MEGEVYLDNQSGGLIEKYKKMTAAKDAEFLNQLSSELGNTGTFGISDICRSYSQRKFNEAPGRLSTPPMNTPIANPTPWYGWPSSIGTWTSR